MEPAISFSRDRISRRRGGIAHRAVYSDVVGFSKQLLSCLAVLDGSDAPLLFQIAVNFWTEHSDRCGLDSWCAAPGFSSCQERLPGLVGSSRLRRQIRAYGVSDHRDVAELSGTGGTGHASARTRLARRGADAAQPQGPIGGIRCRRIRDREPDQRFNDSRPEPRHPAEASIRRWAGETTSRVSGALDRAVCILKSR